MYADSLFLSRYVRAIDEGERRSYLSPSSPTPLFLPSDSPEARARICLRLRPMMNLRGAPSESPSAAVPCLLHRQLAHLVVAADGPDAEPRDPVHAERSYAQDVVLCPPAMDARVPEVVAAAHNALCPRERAACMDELSASFCASTTSLARGARVSFRFRSLAHVESPHAMLDGGSSGWREDSGPSCVCPLVRPQPVHAARCDGNGREPTARSALRFSPSSLPFFLARDEASDAEEEGLLFLME